MQDFRKLSVWSKSHQLVLLIYAATGNVSEKKYPGPHVADSARRRVDPREYRRGLRPHRFS